MLNKTRLAPLLAEFLGVGVLVMVALVLSNTTAVSYFIGTSVAVTLGLLVMMMGGASRHHFNPAVTFGFWSARMMPTLDAISYIAVQLLGALGAWQLYQYLVNRPVSTQTHHWDWRMAIAEMVGAAVLAAAYWAAGHRRLDSLQSAFTIGGAFFVAIMLASTASAGLVNPAVAMGLRNWNAVSVLGPLVGGLVGVNLFALAFNGISKKK